MANIPVEKKSNLSWLWWVLGLVLIGGLIWFLVAAGDDEVETAAVTPATTPEAVAEAPSVTIGDILGTPADYIGDPFSQAEVMVSDVPTDRGFWIEDEGQRLFVILIDGPAEAPLDINTGQTLRIDEGTLRDRTYLPNIEGDPLDADTQAIAESQPIFLVADESNITILER